MKNQSYLLRRLLALIIILLVTGLFILGYHRLQFEADIMASLPKEDAVLADAHYVISHHPIYDRVAVDVAYSGENLDALMEGSALVETGMKNSGLFKEVGFQQIGQLIPELMRHVADHLPMLFSEADLETVVKPLLAPEAVRQIITDQYATLQDLGGIGQMGFLTGDPLGLSRQVLARLAALSPAKGARIHQGRLLSANGRHVLIVAEPRTPGMDTREAVRMEALMASIVKELKDKYGQAGAFTLTPVGAYRAALDNERSAKRNVKKAVLFSTGAIALLLLVGFPRPLIGLLSLLPAFAGTMLAYFVYSLIHPSISLMAVGFGGAIISFTVDYGITYLLFLDQRHETRGMEATKEVWSLGLLAMLTTAVSFAFLSLSGFPVLREIGQFAALGVVFTYILVHTVFPLIFPVVPPARRKSFIPLAHFAERIAAGNGMWKVYTALAFGFVMLLFAKPEFRIDLNAMNAVSEDTLRAEKLIRNTWGDVFGKVYLLVEGRDRDDFRQKSDSLAAFLAEETKSGRISQSFVPSMIFPGEELARRNIAAWQHFWNPERSAALRKMLDETSKPLGFASGAFNPFYNLMHEPDLKAVDTPDRYAPLFGIKIRPDGQARTQLVAVVPGPSYEGDSFYRHVTATGLVKVFDPALFSNHLGSLLQSAFIKMAAIVGLITILTAFFYFLDWRLTVLGIAPTLFAIICTLGTLNLLGEPLGVPVLMVSVVVIGMGTDYALYLVRAYQRYFDEENPSLGLIRLSVFLSFATTFLGFGVLAIADNPMLRSAGLGLALGIGYSYVGAVMLTPPLLKRVFAPVILPDEAVSPGAAVHLRRAVTRYRHMEGYPRLFARFKILLDPMFPRLADFVKNPETIIDVGSGYGVPAVWLLELFPNARVYGVEPDRKRVRFASRAIGTRGCVTLGSAPDLPGLPEHADTALVLDMVHMLTDDELRITIRGIYEKLFPAGTLVLRATVPSGKMIHWKRWIETMRIKMDGGIPHYRSETEILATLEASGFQVTNMEWSAPGEEERWFIATVKKPAQKVIAS
ncbi:MAG: hypothetical protein CSYNP_02298 [Syntrophus sp. SKADARSKE-3]|nr:hypothetical protein [Syntrophus sp. SKADARSKE-3]